MSAGKQEPRLAGPVRALDRFMTRFTDGLAFLGMAALVGAIRGGR